MLYVLRKKIEEIDREIVELMIQRNDTAKEIGNIKKTRGMPLTDRNVENAVIKRYRAAAENTSLPADTAESICRILIKSSVELQTPIVRKRCDERITIIGGNGKMGRWMQRYFEGMGAKVNIIDVSVGGPEDMKDSDVIIISVPISSVGSVLEEADAFCKKDALIFDISSVKTPFSLKLREMAGRRKVCSVHPMFGPSAVSMNERNVIVCNCGSEDAVTEAMGLFDNDGSNIVVTDIGRHDELIAYVLGFAHASNITFFTALRESGIPFRQLNEASSTTFERCLAACLPVSEESASLYHGIQRMNARSEGMWNVYENALKKVRDASLSDDDGMFAELMDSGRRYLKDHL
jgi:chorismate mutase/prephenate dehydrogenase